MKTALTELIERLTDNDELLIDLLWKVKEGKKHPNRAYKELRQAYIKSATDNQNKEDESNRTKNR